MHTVVAVSKTMTQKHTAQSKHVSHSTRATQTAQSKQPTQPTMKHNETDENNPNTAQHWSIDTVKIEDVPPRRIRDVGDLLHALSSVITAIIVAVCAVALRGLTAGVESDAHNALQLVTWLVDIPTNFVIQATTTGITLAVLYQLIAAKEWVKTVVTLISMFCGYLVAWGLTALLVTVHIPALQIAFSSPGLSYSASIPDVYVALAALLTAAGPRNIRSAVKWGWTVLYSVATLMVILSLTSLPGTLVAIALGRLIGMVLRFAVGSESQGVWGVQLAKTLASIDLKPVSIIRRPEAHADSGMLRTSIDDDLVENSRIYDMTDVNGIRYTVSVLDEQLRTAGYVSQLWQWLRLTGVSLRRDRSAQDATAHHMTMLLMLEHIGLACAKPYGIANAAGSSVLVLYTDSSLVECNANTLSDQDAADVIRYVNAAHARGLSHHRITPDTLGRTSDGHVVLAGWHNGDTTGNSTNIVLDNVQLLVLLAALIGPERAWNVACNEWGTDATCALAPFIQRAAIPAPTYSLETCNRTLLSQLRSYASEVANQQQEEQTDAPSVTPATLSRFNVRSFISLVLLIIAISVIITQLKPDDVINALQHADPIMAVLSILLSLTAWAGSAITLGGFMDSDKRNVAGVYASQAASGLTAVSMPAGVGPAFVNLQFLRKSGYSNTKATAITSAVWGIQSLVTVLFIVLLGLLTGRNTVSSMVPSHTLIAVIGFLAIAISVAMAIPAVRKTLITKYVPVLKQFGKQLVAIIAKPRELGIGVLGAVVLNVAISLGFWTALLAFGKFTNPIETMFMFLLANSLASAVPTPGGLGAIEAALTFSFTSVGIPAAVALSATLLYRVAFYWLRIPMGALAMRWLTKHNLM